MLYQQEPRCRPRRTSQPLRRWDQVKADSASTLSISTDETAEGTTDLLRHSDQATHISSLEATSAPLALARHVTETTGEKHRDVQYRPSTSNRAAQLKANGNLGARTRPLRTRTRTPAVHR